MRNRSKRLFDVTVSGIALLLLLPLLLFAALWIRFDSKGPVVFKQRRIGKNKQPFQVLKLRTMIDRSPAEIDQVNERVIVNDRDPRITRSGRFLRSTSLDELPQLWNILRGDMSIVGPRPIIPEQLEVIPREFESRFEVLPGLTGLAQVRGRRSLGWLEQLKADTEYVHRYGFFYDICIILKTVVVVIKGSGIYGREAENWRAYRDRVKAQDGQKR
ncbi:Sugar transferase involved in LPS biosynthesis (colanic, teichoic acid) [Modicisalibacter ilicicola DSM 19980]|uniref:Sugar transferase involved in LPS biosynthesis (Colanic, teichoic acid) n=1 Tax=Modicisalibacter ilicicola DSM 19980 TaxID=1121942 RepID=A0A1M5BZW4_9GAMM|nr:sugar transferase [Halomonas ilicicola]SHF48043.1 Sugar transferase involved in LPS biosynthesis (colanic, teichoic acid) [Halomonas ilicicola DSM 19980]